MECSKTDQSNELLEIMEERQGDVDEFAQENGEAARNRPRTSAYKTKQFEKPDLQTTAVSKIANEENLVSERFREDQPAISERFNSPTQKIGGANPDLELSEVSNLYIRARNSISRNMK